MLYRKSKANEPSSLVHLQNRKKVALESERKRLKYLYEQKLAVEQQRIEQALVRELEKRDTQMRAALGRGGHGGTAKYSSLGGFAGQSTSLGAHISKEARAAFRCVTTDDSEFRQCWHVRLSFIQNASPVPGQTIQKIIGAVSGSFL